MSTNQDGMQTDRKPGSLPLKKSYTVKKSYTAPTLIEYGTVSRLTRFGPGSPIDFSAGTMGITMFPSVSPILTT